MRERKVELICPLCEGKGWYEFENYSQGAPYTDRERCSRCNGTGIVEHLNGADVREIQKRLAVKHEGVNWSFNCEPKIIDLKMMFKILGIPLKDIVYGRKEIGIRQK